MNGVLVLDKPHGWTSHDVVAKVRRLTQVKRVGHTGTLDPLATGVLVVCLGQATRVVEYMIGHAKQYTATVCLGIETDTYDAGGQVVARRPVDVTESALRESLQALVGDIRQAPPMFSAIKRAGAKLVDLARKGITVEREPRPVTIYSLDVLAFDSPHVTIDVHCSAGTYIRSLAHDLGRQLGCGAHLSALRRTAVGDFTLAQAASLEAFEAAVEDGSWSILLRPLDTALSGFPAITLSEEDVARARHGLALAVRGELEAHLVRAYDLSGQIIGLMRFDPTRSELRPEKIFHLTPDT